MVSRSSIKKLGYSLYLQNKIQRLYCLLDLSLRNNLKIRSGQCLCDFLDLRQTGLWHRGPHHGGFDETAEPNRCLVPDMEATDVLENANSSFISWRCFLL